MKVKHAIIISVYLITVLIALVVMIQSKDGNGLAAFWLASNICYAGAYLLYGAIKWIVLNWNEKLNF